MPILNAFVTLISCVYNPAPILRINVNVAVNICVLFCPLNQLGFIHSTLLLLLLIVTGVDEGIYDDLFSSRPIEYSNASFGVD